MTQALTTQAPAPLALSYVEPTREQLDLLKRTIARGTTDDEFRLFLEACKRRRFDPFSKLIYPVKRYDSQASATIMALQSSIDSFRLVAERTGKYEGQVGPFWCGPDKAWHDVWLEDDAPKASRVGVWRAGFKEPLWGVALWSNYVQTTKSGDVTKFWRQMGPLMLAKCAESQALRRAFPEDLAGLYTSEEMQQAEHVDVNTTTGEMRVEPAKPPAQRQVAAPAPKPAAAAPAPAQQPRTIDTTTAKPTQAAAPQAAQQPADGAGTDEPPIYHEDGSATVFGIPVAQKVWQGFEGWKHYTCIENKQSKSCLKNHSWEQAVQGSVDGDRERALRWCVEAARKDLASGKPLSQFSQRAAWVLNLMLEDRAVREANDERADGVPADGGPDFGTAPADQTDDAPF